MQIKEATEYDISGIIKVLKASLGETSSRKTEEVWRYKHIDNPFGKSLVLIAEEDEEIIGVRAFMRWEWQKGEKIFSAFRAVDTATHPAHQGKGVFKKLTLKALELAKERGYHFVFNTPNSQSKPGYLKMGWKEIAKVKISIQPCFNLGFKGFSYDQAIQQGGLDTSILSEFHDLKKKKKSLFIPKNAIYLNWRYKNCRLQSYLVYEDEEIFVAAYLKKRKWFNELRVSEVIALNTSAEKKAKAEISNFAKLSGAQAITAHPDFIGFNLSFGPVLTQKNINLSSKEILDFQELSSWNYSLGDLELF